MPIAVPAGVTAVEWAAWFPDLLPQVPGCPNIVARNELRSAARVLLSESRAWTAILPVQAIVIDQDTLTLDLTGAELVRIEEAWYDGTPMDVQTTPEALSAALGDDWRVQTGTPTAVLMDSPEVVRLYPVPNADATTGLKLRVALQPSKTATGMPGDLARRYHEQILAGAKARLMLMPGKPWSNGDLATVQAAVFNQGVDRANLDAATGFGRGRIQGRVRWC